MPESLTIIFTPKAGSSVEFQVTREIPELGSIEGGTLAWDEDALRTPRELWESVAEKPEELTAFLEDLSASGDLSVWCLDAAWRKLRRTLHLSGTDRVGHWPLKDK